MTLVDVLVILLCLVFLQSLITLELVADLSYAWIHIDRYSMRNPCTVSHTLLCLPPIPSLLSLHLISPLSFPYHLILSLSILPSPSPLSSPSSYTSFMQEFIKKQPSLVIKLRSTFLKVGDTASLHIYMCTILPLSLPPSIPLSNSPPSLPLPPPPLSLSLSLSLPPYLPPPLSPLSLFLPPPPPLLTLSLSLSFSLPPSLPPPSLLCFSLFLPPPPHLSLSF